MATRGYSNEVSGKSACGKLRQKEETMTTLVISAPWCHKDEVGQSVGKPGEPHSFETYFKTGIGIGYAISDENYNKLSQAKDCVVVLLRKDRLKQRAEGHLIKLSPTGKFIHGRQRYDVHFKGQNIVTYKPEKLDHYGVAVPCSSDC